MTQTIKWHERLQWFSESVWFVRTHFFTVFGLGLIAALGRAIQMKAFGPISPTTHLLLEIIIESARLLLFLYALGLTHVRTGTMKVVRIFTAKKGRKRNVNIALHRLKTQWLSLLSNLLVFLLFAWALNFLIDYAAYQTCLYAQLKTSSYVSDQISVWAFILFFKNISVIPFTLVFNALFLLWITNTLKRPVI